MKKSILIMAILVATIAAFAQNVSVQKDFNRHEIRVGIGDPFVAFYSAQPNTMNHICPPINIEYHYRALKWLWVGGGINFYGSFEPDKKAWQLSTPYLSTRFSYFNREHVILYSGFSASLFAITDSAKNLKRTVYSHFTLFGVSAGNRNWFGSAELGLGYKGFLNLGFGYRF